MGYFFVLVSLQMSGRPKRIKPVKEKEATKNAIDFITEHGTDGKPDGLNAAYINDDIGASRLSCH